MQTNEEITPAQANGILVKETLTKHTLAIGRIDKVSIIYVVDREYSESTAKDRSPRRRVSEHIDIK